MVFLNEIGIKAVTALGTHSFFWIIYGLVSNFVSRDAIL